MPWHSKMQPLSDCKLIPALNFSEHCRARRARSSSGGSLSCLLADDDYDLLGHVNSNKKNACVISGGSANTIFTNVVLHHNQKLVLKKACICMTCATHLFQVPTQIFFKRLMEFSRIVRLDVRQSLTIHQCTDLRKSDLRCPVLENTQKVFWSGLSRYCG